MNAFYLKLPLQLHTTAYRRIPVTTHTQKEGGREAQKENTAPGAVRSVG